MTISFECTDCRLHKTRTNIVFGNGPIPCDVILIGEAPGKDENEQSRPFVGAAGKILNLLLMNAGIERKDVYITNVVKCRPPGNRRPSVVERSACRKHLDKELELVQPSILILMGNTALSSFVESTDSCPMHGVSYKYKRWTVWPLYHPAYAIYRRDKLPIMMEEYKRALTRGERK